MRTLTDSSYAWDQATAGAHSMNAYYMGLGFTGWVRAEAATRCDDESNYFIKVWVRPGSDLYAQVEGLWRGYPVRLFEEAT